MHDNSQWRQVLSCTSMQCGKDKYKQSTHLHFAVMIAKCIGWSKESNQRIHTYQETYRNCKNLHWQIYTNFRIKSANANCSNVRRMSLALYWNFTSVPAPPAIVNVMFLFLLPMFRKQYWVTRNSSCILKSQETWTDIKQGIYVITFVEIHS